MKAGPPFYLCDSLVRPTSNKEKQTGIFGKLIILSKIQLFIVLAALGNIIICDSLITLKTIIVIKLYRRLQFKGGIK